MNEYKHNWFLATQGVDTTVRSQKHIENNPGLVDQWWDNAQIHLKRSKRWLTSPEAIFVYEIGIGIFMPAATIGAKARKTVSIINALYDEMTRD